MLRYRRQDQTVEWACDVCNEVLPETEVRLVWRHDGPSDEPVTIANAHEHCIETLARESLTEPELHALIAGVGASVTVAVAGLEMFGIVPIASRTLSFVTVKP